MDKFANAASNRLGLNTVCLSWFTAAHFVVLGSALVPMGTHGVADVVIDIVDYLQHPKYNQCVHQVPAHQTLTL
jgi:hypothetical protein